MKYAIIFLIAISVSLMPLTKVTGEVIFEDDFSSGNLNNWMILSGSWSVINEEMCGIADGSTITPNTGILTSYTFTTDARYEQGLGWGIDFRYIDNDNRIRLDFAPGAPNQLNVNIYENGSLAAQPYAGTCTAFGSYTTQHYCKFIVDGSYFEVYFGNDPNDLVLLCTYTYPALDTGTIRYQAWGYPPNVMSCFDNVLVTSDEDEWILVYEEDFSSDPGWITNNGSHFYWNSSEENYYVHIEDDLNEYGVIQIPEMDGSYKIEYDAKMTQNDWSSALIFGIFDDEIAYKPGSPPQVDTLSSLVLMFDHAGGGTGFTIHSYTPPLVCDALNDWCGTSLNQWYHVVIEYDSATSTASSVVTLDGSVVSSNTLDITGSYQGLTYLGISRRWHWYVTGATTIGYVDNVALYERDGMLPEITLTPYNPPIIIPPGGDSFSYNAEVANNGSSPVTFDVWVNIEVPGGYQFPTVGPVYDLTLSAGNSLDRDRTVFVPSTAPAGEYDCIGMIGTYPWVIIDSDAFTFTKEGPAGEGIWTGPEGWFCTGELFPGEVIVAEEALPEEFSFQGAYPNPFNPITTLTYSLPAVSRVTLSIYDMQGRLVSTLVDGFRDPGTHEAHFDAAGLPSGIYFARLEASGNIGIQKLVLLK